MKIFKKKKKENEGKLPNDPAIFENNEPKVETEKPKRDPEKERE